MPVLHCLESTSPQDLFNLLPSGHRKTFLRLLEQPDSPQTQSLLASAQDNIGWSEVEHDHNASLLTQTEDQLWWNPTGIPLSKSEADEHVHDVDQASIVNLRPVDMSDNVDSKMNVPHELARGLRFNILATW